MTDLANHPGKWLRADAAASLDRMEDAHGGAFDISDAGRTEAEQQDLIDRWDEGGAANRPPYLYQPGRPASQSPHVSDGGHAVDVIDEADRDWIKDHSEFGWRFDVNGDVVHMNYYSNLDATSDGSVPESGDYVTKLEQAFLNQFRGESLVVDGIKGDATTAAFERYQTFLRDYGYAGEIDGIWGDGTQAAHAVYYAQVTAPVVSPQPSRPVIQQGSSGQEVADLQHALNVQYPAYSSLVEDGEFGPATDAVVREFQTRAGLVVDGIVGDATWAALHF